MPRATPTIAIVHTSTVSVEPLTELFAELAPDVRLQHIVDDSLLREVVDAGDVTHDVLDRLGRYFEAAELAGADLIVSQCSSVGEAADLAAARVGIPVVKVDERMARAACETGRRIGVVATLATTLGPTSRLLESSARSMAREIEVERCLVEGAFDLLTSGDRSGHDRRVLAAIRDLATRVDVVVCAQGSMAAVLEELGETPVPVLTSPRLGVAHALEVLRKP